MASPFAIAAVVLALIYLALRALINFTQHPDEPPAVLTSIPFLEPIICLLQRRYKIWQDVKNKFNLPIYTLRTPLARIYVVNDTSLIPAVERQNKVLAFSPIEAEAMVHLLEMSDKTNQTLRTNPTGEDGHFITYHHAVRPALAPGPGLDDMNRIMVDTIATSLTNLRQQSSPVVKLFDWVQHEIIMATTDAEFGPYNPFRDPEVERIWLKFESHVPILSLGAFPRVLAREGLEAREFVVSRFLQYFQQGHYRLGSSFLHARFQHGQERGLTLEDAARGEVGAAMAIINNTVAASFWILFHLFSNPGILEECRRELQAGGISTDEDGTQVLDLDHVKFNCPVLVSTLQEVFRYRGIGTLIIRSVLEDHKLSGRYLLKKGAIILMPNSVQHFDPSIWGADVNEFNHRRWLPDPKTGKKRRYNPSAFRIFGSGSTLCPGRHFANNEILAFAALTILQFDLRPKANNGRWEANTNHSFGMGVARVFLIPEKDFDVELFSRIQDRNQRWRVHLTGSKKAVHTLADEMEAHEKAMHAKADAEAEEKARVRKLSV